MPEKIDKRIKTVLALQTANIVCAWCSIAYTIFAGGLALFIASEVEEISSSDIWLVSILSLFADILAICLISQTKKNIRNREKYILCLVMMILSSVLINYLSMLLGLIAVLILAKRTVRMKFDNRTTQPLYPSQETTDYID